MRLIDADALNVVTAKVPKGMDAKSYMAGMEYVLGQVDAMPVIEERKGKWIPCSERLPEESGEYLCTLVGVHNTGLPSECGYEPPNNRGITSGWSTCEADGFKFLRDDEVLAWMPLPDCYEGDA